VGEFFNVDFTTNLASGFTTTVLTNVQATPPTNTFTIPGTLGVGFYRLRF
jgi:hypothetical protein